MGAGEAGDGGGGGTVGAGEGQSDMEKELTCSICADLLYQPLTLLDCLHTFCGACLKEWFAFQASTATTIHPYTCPACRASVRSTQPNAFVTTLLDKHVRANPGRGKTDDEKQADRARYRPGDNVLPKLRRREEHDEDEEDEERRMLGEVQALSLREAGILPAPSLAPPSHSRERSRESRRSRRSPATTTTATTGTARAIEHQSSLRSLLSSSELDSDDVDEDLVRQVLEELVAEGVDLNQIGPSQEEDITERIAEAVRRRQAERQADRQRDRRERRVRDDDTSRRQTQARGRSQSGASTPQNTSTLPGPPISRPDLIDAANRHRHAQHQRSSSQGSSRSARLAARPAALSVSSARHSSHQVDHLTISDSVAAPRRRQSDQGHPGTLEARQQFRRSLQTTLSPNITDSPRLAFNISASESPTASIAAITTVQSAGPRRTTDPTGVRQHPSSNHGTPPLIAPPSFPRSTTDPAVNDTRPQQHALLPVPPAPTLYAEPQVSCQHCDKEHIEHELHYHCSKCNHGNYDLCHHCYRASKGCKHWFGFGWAAWARYERDRPEGGYPSGYEQPHILTGHRYQRPLSPLTKSLSPPHVLMSEDEPRRRLERGVFCDTCKAFANTCYWKCDFCNEGDWGFCNDCVNQGRHCTHPLLPVAHEAKDVEPINRSTTSVAPSMPRPSLALQEADPTAPTPPLTPKSASFSREPNHIIVANLVFRPLNFTTLCNICRYSIPSADTRYHCLKCNAGDFDICMACYHKLNVSSRITKEDGIGGWRKCLRGHRMVIVGFEDRDGGQRRIVIRDLVGGFALKEDDDTMLGTRSPTPGVQMREWKWRDYDGNVQNYRAPSSVAIAAHRFPPDGGVGLRLKARWSYWPEDGIKDELAFPRHAEVREATDINGDWYWGVYCGTTGLLPANFVTTI
ncbi:hypothetical protein GQ44DRAFT_831393 [Phaeosphaeriaceae sp. PMI808]|nr:hypothetical protein GQ44DRAFT_831393 [Phaeosphaeriaceae sp. PMI808]